MSAWALTLGGLAVAGAAIGGSVAWWATDTTQAQGQEIVAEDEARAAAPSPARVHDEDVTGDTAEHLHDLDDFSEVPAAGRQVDVWLDEPPLGPLSGGPPAPATPEEAVAGYLTAAHTVTADDAAIRHRRHHPWLHPDAPARTGGIWTLDPPAEGVERSVELVDLEVYAAAEAGTALQVVYRLWDGPELHAERTRYVTTRQTSDRHWFVMTETVQPEPIAH